MSDNPHQDKYFAAFRSIFPEGTRFKSCMDLGCGKGEVTELFAPLCDYTYGVDFNDEDLDEAKKRMPKGMFRKLDLGKDKIIGQYNLLICTGSIPQYVYGKNDREAIDNFFKIVEDILIPGGYMVVANNSVSEGMMLENLPFLEVVKDFPPINNQFVKLLRRKEELKTLKDFEYERQPNPHICGGYEEIRKAYQLDLIKEQRQELIKWIKAIREKSKEAWDKRSDFFTKENFDPNKPAPDSFEVGVLKVWINEEASDDNGMIEILKHIGNISEEELK
jgi:SAM-dependent methyltransferase